jgi:hypothetical protein
MHLSLDSPSRPFRGAGLLGKEHDVPRTVTVDADAVTRTESGGWSHSRGVPSVVDGSQCGGESG